jgi:hypothetical protein
VVDTKVRGDNFITWRAPTSGPFDHSRAAPIQCIRSFKELASILETGFEIGVELARGSQVCELIPLGGRESHHLSGPAFDNRIEVGPIAHSKARSNFRDECPI